MNQVLRCIHQRRSTRAFEPREVEAEIRETLLRATLRAPTAGNLMLYSILDIREQAIKDTLARTCDNQPFIASAPMVWIFLADYQRWYDYFTTRQSAGTVSPRKPREADLLLACCDALAAAQTAVLAAESLGLASCYIGDILENYETHRDLLHLARYTFPIAMLCLGYATQQQRARPLTTRFDENYIVYRDRYRRLDAEAFEAMFADEDVRYFSRHERSEDSGSIAQVIYRRKYTAAFSEEMRRSVRVMLSNWSED